jgi:hypothetical protein
MRRDGSGKEGVTIGDGECVRATERAVLVELHGPRDVFGGHSVRQVWIPKSVLHDDSEVFEDGGTGAVIVHRWWADQEGFTG